MFIIIDVFHFFSSFILHFVLILEVQNAISPFEDVLMRGHISWVGTSSMEVIMVVEQVIYAVCLYL